MQKRSHYIPLGILLVLCLSSPLNAKTPSLQSFQHPRLVESGEVIGVISDPAVRIIDLRSSLLDYLKGHIPNSVYLHFESLRVPDGGIPAQAPDRICLERLLGENLSISNDMGVILYSEKSNPNATYLAWTLDFLGHRRVGVLNGGWEKWVSEGHPVTQVYPALSPKKFFGKVKPESLAEKKFVRDHLGNKGVVIVDARAPRQYSGEEGEEIRRGHIPGAKNVFWETTLEGDNVRHWKRKEDLEKLFADSGINRDKEVIVHCRTGREASHLYFTLRFVLGYPHVRLYRGSWVEWSADRSMPVRTGPEP